MVKRPQFLLSWTLLGLNIFTNKREKVAHDTNQVYFTMKTYEFNSKTGYHIIATTERVNEIPYFKVYVDCEALSVKNKWATLLQKNDEWVLNCGPVNEKPLFIGLPKDIASEMVTDMQEACVIEDKIIVVTVKRENGDDYYKPFYSKAIALPMFQSMIYYRLSADAERKIRAFSADGIIMDMGGIEDNPESRDALICYNGDGSATRYQFRADRMLTAKSPLDPEGDDEIFTVELRLADLF